MDPIKTYTYMKILKNVTSGATKGGSCRPLTVLMNVVGRISEKD